jgi:hypothetical protein
VTVEMAAVMISHAKDIIDWCEALLPPNFHRPRLAVNHSFYFSIKTGDFPTLQDLEDVKGKDHPSTDSSSDNAQ